MLQKDMINTTWLYMNLLYLFLLDIMNRLNGMNLIELIF